jgi:uncharacterized membrane protein YphA (DoxX/SURF4 family)
MDAGKVITFCKWDVLGADASDQIASMAMAGRFYRAPGGWPAVLPFRPGQTLRSGTPGTNARDFRLAGIPFAKVNAIFVSALEFVFGLLLILGWITRLACIMLGGVMIVAIATSAIRSIKAPPVLGWLSELLYLPEVLCLVILFWLFLSGPGWFSLDYLLFFR